MKSRKPRNGFLRRRIERVRVHSNSDGSFGIEAKWRTPYVTRADEGQTPVWVSEIPPGLFTRMATAEELERHLNYILGATDNG